MGEEHKNEYDQEVFESFQSYLDGWNEKNEDTWKWIDDGIIVKIHRSHPTKPKYQSIVKWDLGNFWRYSDSFDKVDDAKEHAKSRLREVLEMKEAKRNEPGPTSQDYT